MSYKLYGEKITCTTCARRSDNTNKMPHGEAETHRDMTHWPMAGRKVLDVLFNSTQMKMNGPSSSEGRKTSRQTNRTTRGSIRRRIGEDTLFPSPPPRIPFPLNHLNSPPHPCSSIVYSPSPSLSLLFAIICRVSPRHLKGKPKPRANCCLAPVQLLLAAHYVWKSRVPVSSGRWSSGVHCGDALMSTPPRPLSPCFSLLSGRLRQCNIFLWPRNNRSTRIDIKVHYSVHVRHVNIHVSLYLSECTLNNWG